MSRRIRSSRSLRRHGRILAQNKSKVATVVGVTGFLVSIVVTAIQAPKARDALDELDAEIAYDCEHEHIEPPSAPEKLWMQTKRVVPIMAPTVVLAVFSTACIAGGHKSLSNELAASVAAYEMKDRALKSYVANVKETLGEKKESEIRDSYYEKEALKDIPEGPDDRCIICTGEGDYLYRDNGTKQWFRASPRWLDHCRHEISKSIFTYDSASANELADIIGIEPTEFGNLLGFDTDDLDSATHLIDMRWNRCYMSPWGEPYAVVEYSVHERFRDN